MADLKSQYLTIKNLLKKVEQKNYSKESVQELNDLFYELFEALKLSLISDRDTYYGYFLLNLTCEIRTDQNTIAGIKLNVYPPVMVVNPLLFCKFRLSEMVFIFAHEIEHIVLNHPYEIMLMNPDHNQDMNLRLNYACDASVNDRLILEKDTMSNHNFMNPIEGCVTSNTIREITHNQSILSNQDFLYYYKFLDQCEDVPEKGQYDYSLEQFKENNEEQQDGSGSLKKEDESNQEEGSGGAGSSQNIGDEESLKDIHTILEIDDHNFGQNEVDEAFIRENTKAFLNQTRNSIMLGRGLVPFQIEEAIAKLDKPPVVNWTKVLKKYIGTLPYGKRSTSYRLNRRQPFRYDLKGTFPDHILNIVVAIDTSGSMDAKTLGKCINEIFSLLRKKKYVLTIIECDSEIQKVYQAKNIGQVDFHVKGRGGTSFTPVIVYLNEHKEYRNSLLVYFTDGSGEDSIPKPLLYRILWVLSKKNDQLSLQNPCGEIVHL